jgi:DNA-binding MltR family transcriptional regulator
MTDKPTSLGEDPTMVERVAKALYMHAVTQAREQIAAEAFPIEKIVTVFEEATTASDREAAIVIFCLVDDLATDFFRRKLTGRVSSGVDETFLTGNGILASAHNKIALLAGLEWIANETYRNITLLRKIRNEFAHHVEYKHFEDRPICNYINSLSARETSIIESINANERPAGLLVRSKFLVRSCLSVFELVRDMAVIQAAIAHQVDPRSVSLGFHEEPENIKDLLRTTARIALEIILSQPPQNVSAA